MLKTYEVIIDNGQITWLDEPPKIVSAPAIITILEEKLVEETSTPKVLETAKEMLEEELAKKEAMKEVLVQKASQILAKLDGQAAKKRLEEEIAKNEAMKEVLVQKASQILAKLGGSQPDLQPIHHR